MNLTFKDTLNLICGLAFSLALYLGLYQGNEICWNVTSFISILLGLLSTLSLFFMFLAGPEKVFADVEKQSKFKQYNNTVFFLINIVITAGAGHFVVATWISVHFLYMLCIWNHKNKQKRGIS